MGTETQDERRNLERQKIQVGLITYLRDLPLAVQGDTSLLTQLVDTILAVDTASSIGTLAARVKKRAPDYEADLTRTYFERLTEAEQAPQHTEDFNPIGVAARIIRDLRPDVVQRVVVAQLGEHEHAQALGESCKRFMIDRYKPKTLGGRKIILGPSL